MNSKGGIFLNYEKFQFMKYRVIPNKIYWSCTQRRSLKCPARISQDTETNRITIVKPDHNHEIISQRRVSGQLKSDRVKMGLPAEYLKPKKKKTKTN